MPAIVRLPTAVRNSILQVILDLLDAGSGPATIKFYTGTQPAVGGGSIGGSTLLGTVTCSDPAAGAPAGGTLTFSAITEDTAADASGTATWCRVADSAGNTVLDGDVGAEGSGAFCELNTTAIVQDGPIRISSAALSVPAGTG